ncbi:hypothetical protein [Sulfuriroseicoccus oceanibius]|uniref:Uncharacterized protein n=1 Tax=Sulfuriroseicoccus oceanibius TaxID=2707525 RepID=A0A6B3L8B6_9BACT|nr:hypothetical protein [Sulfuriroseicoccus oceanibius]QQL46083.1 hypothetical protein G3M56_005745 [Sulfuriroseicoccus oceanibius]
MSNVFSKRPWLWVIIAFLVLIGSWLVLFKLALGNRPQSYDPRKGETYPEGVVPGSGHPAAQMEKAAADAAEHGGSAAEVETKEEAQ